MKKESRSIAGRSQRFSAQCRSRVGLSTTEQQCLYLLLMIQM